VANNINDYAIIIGIDNYPQLRPLSSAVSDATRFAEWLVSPEGGGLPQDNVQLILSPSEPPANPYDARPLQHDVDKALARLVGNGGMRVGRRLYFYFAGHGIGPSVDDVGMLLANASLSRLGSNIGLRPYRHFFRQAGLFDELVFIVDCSRDPYLHVPTVPPSLFVQQNESLANVKELIILAAAYGRRAFNTITDKGEARGVLTAAVLNGLEGMATDPQGRITSSTLSDYIRRRMPELTPELRQEPDVILSGGEIVFQSANGKATLTVELPHWTAGVEIRGQFNLVPNVGPIRTQEETGVVVSETKLPPGIYEVTVTLEGKSAQRIVAVVPNQNNIIKQDAWKDLTMACAAPLVGATTTSNTGYADAAKKWSIERTWDAGAHSGDSGLFIFMSAADPEERSKFAASLFLIDGDGKLVTTFSEDQVERDDEAGWVAFNANLKPGYYVLRRGRHYRIRQQGVFLCPGWQTQVFLKTKTRRRPSLRLMTLNMAPLDKGFEPEDETTVAAEAVLDVLRYGGKSKQLLTSDKMSALLKRKTQNPWLGILAAYVLRPYEHSSHFQKSVSESPNFRRQDDLDSATLFDEVMQFLISEISEHPDVRALRLMRGNDETPFPHPPLLRAGLKLVQRHSTRMVNTIPLNSLTDLVLDNLVLNSPWTAWRELMPSSSDQSLSSPFAEDALLNVTTPRPRRRRATKSISTQTLLQSETAAAPVFNVTPDDEAKNAAPSGLERDSSLPAPTSAVALYEAILIQEAARLARSIAEDFEEKHELDFKKLLNDLLMSPEELSELSGMPLSRTAEALEGLRRYGDAPPTLDGNAREELLSQEMQVVFNYAMQRSAQRGQRPQSSETDAMQPVSPLDAAPPTTSATIEDIVLKLRAEARRLMQVGGDRPEAKELSDRLRRVSNKLLQQADFNVLTRPQGALLRGNAAFRVLVLPSAADIEAGADIKEIWQKSCSAWESLLVRASTGRSVVSSPVQNSISADWELRRIAINDSVKKTTQAYLNLLRCPGSQRPDKIALLALDALMPELALDASYFAHGAASRQQEYGQSLTALISKLENISTAAPAESDAIDSEGSQYLAYDMPPESASQLLINDPELKKADATLYEGEFWGIERHELIAGVAQDQMSSEKAKKALRGILPVQGMMLSDVAGWADTVKRRGPDPLKDDKETIAFLKDARNKNNHLWHYVNLPLGAKEYSRETYPEFTRDDDVVQIMRESIRVLQGQSDRFSEFNALRLLVHLAGDVHQPAHVGCCYIDRSTTPPELIRDPKLVLQKGLKSDEGGNQLLLPIGSNGVSLHSYWDSRLGGTIKPEDFLAGEGAPSDQIEDNAPEFDPELKQKFISKLRAMIDEEPSEGDAAAEADLESPELWPQRWASQSLLVAQEAYSSLKITAPSDGKFIVAWEGKEEYDKRCKPLVIQQMKLAAQNLAALLDTILG